MHHLFTEFVLAVTPSPSPSPQFDENQVTPGPWGFVITFTIAIIVVLLVVDMVRRVRRVNYRAEIDERLQVELAERDAAAGTAAPSDGSTSKREGDSGTTPDGTPAR
ncbi:hypothetical protein KXS11_02665 [Plantibacter flavus]